MKTIQQYSIILFCLISFWGCNKKQVEKASIDFDKAFIPVFYYAYVNDAEQAERAFIVLDHKWKKLSAQFAEHAYDAHNWEASFCMIDAWLGDVDYAISIDDMNLALTQLDHARYEWIDLRWREGMTYYLDYLWDLEATIDLLVEISDDPVYYPQESEAYMLMVYDMEAAWNILQANTWESDFFDIDKTEEAKRKASLGQKVENYIKIAASAEKKHICIAATEMEQSYLDYMILFGDFKASRTYFAKK